ncbi:glycosyltransferase family 1 protein [Micromonospora ureilytica]|uniref:glycosyltransferase family 4 protein n=1 Tax=Micromonospora ureilytica TaxID=709868 RepID=UPI0033ED2D8D
MRVLFDCRFIRVPRHDGISRYTTGLVGALSRNHDVEMLICDPAQLALLPDLPWHLAGSPWSPRELFVARRIRELGPDVVFSPLQTMGSWQRTYGLVLTLHDVIFHRHRTPPPVFPAPLRLAWRLYHLAWWPQRVLLNRADQVVTVSHTTADLMARYRLTRRPVTVVPNAPDPSPTRHAGTPKRHLLYVGTFMPYKNVETLVRAVALLPGYTLHLISEVAAADRRRLEALAPDACLVFHDGADDEKYQTLVSTATALVTASRDEGFGLPLVEAMAAGTPVVASDIPIFREVCGDAGTYADPDDPAAFAAAVRSLEDPDRWLSRAAASLELAAGYSWERSAAALAEVLKRAASR